MGREWKIGDPVDYTSDGWMDAQNWTGDYYIEKDDPDNDKSQQASAISDKAWELYMNRRDGEALDLINEALSLYDKYYNDWNRKALILQSLKRFKESEACYDRAIALNKDKQVIENKAIMLRIWANELYFSSKDLPKALNLVNKAIDELSALPGKESDIANYRNFAEEIRDKIKAIETSRKSKEFNYLKNNLPSDVIRELTKNRNALDSQIYSLISFIKDFEMEMDCIFNRAYYSNRNLSGSDSGSGIVSGLLLEFHKNRKYLNSSIISEYYPGQEYVSYDQMCVERIDEKYFSDNTELSQLKKTMEKEGYEYLGTGYLGSEPLVKLELIFQKENLLYREFDFSLKDSKIVSGRESIDVSSCYHSSRCRESEIIKREVKRIENEYGCSLAHIEAPATMYFKKNYSRENLKLEYNYQTKKIEKYGENDLTLEKYNKKDLISITGTYHDCLKKFEKGLKFKLKRELIARDDIAVYLDGDKIGYVARYGCPSEVSKSDEITISENTCAEYLIHYYKSGQFYHIARIIR